MSKNKSELEPQINTLVDENALFKRISEIIEYRTARAGAYANLEATLMFWEVGEHINSVVLDGGRGSYGKQIVVTLARQLSWSHFIALLPVKSNDAFIYYAQDAIARQLGKRELRRQIKRKTFERKEIADSQLSNQSTVPFNMFKDPYLLDALGLKDSYHEADLEKAILFELEAFILEFGHGFTFVERQKRMICATFLRIFYQLLFQLLVV